MKTLKTKLVAGLIASGVVAGGVAAIAISDEQPERSTAVAGPQEITAVAQPQPSSANIGAAHQTSRTALRESLNPGGSNDGYLKDVDWATARSFAIPGTELRGWVMNQGADKRCLAMPDPDAEGYGVTCKTSGEVAAGQGSVIVLSNPSLVGVMVNSGMTAKVDGANANLQRSGNVYSGTASAGSKLAIGDHSITVNPPQK